MPSKKFFTSDKRQDNIASNLNQVIDVIQEDISGSATRRKYQTFVTGGIGPGVTSSLYQTVYDQDHTLQTANAVMDMTVGLFQDDLNASPRLNLVTIEEETGYVKTSNNQLIFDAKSTMMMREKVNVYRQYAKLLLGNADLPFCIDVANASCTVPLNNNETPAVPADIKSSTKILDACLFVNVKRLFARDRIRKETFAMRVYENSPKWYQSGAQGLDAGNWVWNYNPEGGTELGLTESSIAAVGQAQANLGGTGVESSEIGVKIIADIGASQFNQSTRTGGQWAFIKHAGNINEHVGIIFYEAGIAVLNLGGSTQFDNSTWGSTLTTGGGAEDSNGYHYSGARLSNNQRGGDGGEGQFFSVTTQKIKPLFTPRNHVNGIINGMIASHDSTQAGNTKSGWGATQPNDIVAGQVYVGYTAAGYQGAGGVTQEGQGGPQVNPTARFYPDLLVSASIDDIVDHIGFTRFSSGSLTATAFQNVTNINSSIFFCRATASQFNGSLNPTWTDSTTGEWLLNNSGTNSQPYTYITSVLLYDDEDKIVAIAKLNRPIEKNNQSELTIRVRLDF